jgi:hypothetical protein
MKWTYYIVAAICGLFGVLGLLRFIETVAFGGRVFPIQLLFGVVGLSIALLCIKKARAS